MKNCSRVPMAALLLTAGMAMSSHAVLSAEDEHAAHHPETNATSPAGTTSSAALPGPTAEVAANMKKMQEQMAAIRATTEPKERGRLLEAHMQAMQVTMQGMQKGDGCMMTSSNGMPMQGSEARGGTGMMQMMMDQMMQHQKAMKGAAN
jgi:hypothetical protein